MTDKPELGAPAIQDTAVELASAYASSIPIVGPIIATAIKDTIPNVRMERIETYIQSLQNQIDELELKAALETPEGIDTFEEGIWQSARAVSQDRKERIATLVTKGLKHSGNEQQQARHFLRLINQLDDMQIVILTGYLDRHQELGTSETREFYELHPNIFGPLEDEDAEFIRGNLVSSMENHLASFGLIEVAAEDWNGRTTRYKITPLGRNFMTHLGLADEDGF